MIIKSKEDFDKFIDKNKHQVFLVSSFMPRPISFVRHFYFVTNEKGNINRWEIIKYINKDSYYHIHVNKFPYWRGFRKNFPKSSKIYFNVKIFKIYEDKEARELIKIIYDSKYNYPHRFDYKAIRNNCNTYIKWILNQFGDNIKLPTNAIGKYKK